jgi:hypothetical protein
MKAKRTPTPSPNPDQPAGIPANVTAQQSVAYRDLSRLLDLLRVTRGIAAEWLRAGHGHDCRCDFCGYRHRLADDPPELADERYGAQVEGDVRGIILAAGRSIDALDYCMMRVQVPKLEEYRQRAKRSPKRVKK